jgi:hypothetical protein
MSRKSVHSYNAVIKAGRPISGVPLRKTSTTVAFLFLVEGVLVGRQLGEPVASVTTR